MKPILIITFFIFFISCNSPEKETKVTETKTSEKEKFVPDMYEASPMTLLMRSMLEVNKEIKKEILAGKTPKDFPEEFMGILTANLTDNEPHNETFKAYSKLFLDNEKAIFDSKSTIALKERYNTAINTCISCHTTECVGPIPRIKKLLIK